MNKVRTVSDTKREFYAHHTRPINSIYRRVVEELLVEMHLLSVNSEFKSDPIYCLGVFTSFYRLMQGYRPEQDKESIFSALCQAVGNDPQQYRTEAESALALGERLSSAEELVSWLQSPIPSPGEEKLAEAVAEISDNPHFKYSRLFAIGLYTLLEAAIPEDVKEEKKRNRALEQLAEVLNLPAEKMMKDLEFYRGNLEKVEQLLKVLQETLEADRKKREQREQEAQEKNEASQSSD
ncbi:MAG: photosystem II biogenesis protein Psp29 [Cyanophyceae cyanobacterium]